MSMTQKPKKMLHASGELVLTDMQNWVGRIEEVNVALELIPELSPWPKYQALIDQFCYTGRDRVL